MNEENLKLWEQVKETPKKYLKEVKFGRSFTSIDPYFQIRLATKLWGSYGSTWGFKDIQLGYELSHINIVTFKGVFYYPDGEFPIINAVHIMTSEKKEKAKLDTDFAKKVETDTLTKALSKLGFSADIFLGNFEDEKDKEVSLADDNILKSIDNIKDQEGINKFIKENAELLNKNAELRKYYMNRKKELSK